MGAGLDKYMNRLLESAIRNSWHKNAYFSKIFARFYHIFYQIPPTAMDNKYVFI